MADDQELMAKALAGLPATAPQPVAKGWLQYLKDAASDPSARAALSTRQSMQPLGGRREGAATAVLENYLPHVANQLQTLPQRALEAAGQLQSTGQYDPGPAVETALMTVGSPLTPKGALGSSMRKPWKPETVDMLRALRGQNMPVKDIANELGVTKNAVVGKLNREGLTDPTNLGGDRRSPMAALRTSTPRQQPTAPAGMSATDRTALELEGMLTKYAQGKMKAPEVQKAFKDKGWKVDLRRGTYDFEAHDPTGKPHYLTP